MTPDIIYPRSSVPWSKSYLWNIYSTVDCPALIYRLNRTVMATVTISWSLSLCRLLAKHKDTLLASKTSPYSVVNFDPTVRPPKRFGDDETEERVVLLGRIPYVYPGLKVDIRGDRDRDRNRIVSGTNDRRWDTANAARRCGRWKTGRSLTT